MRLLQATSLAIMTLAQSTDEKVHISKIDTEKIVLPLRLIETNTP